MKPASENGPEPAELDLMSFAGFFCLLKYGIIRNDDRKGSAKYELAFFTQNESRHLQNYVLSDLLEIDIGYGGHEHAAALKPAFKVLFDHSGTVEKSTICRKRKRPRSGAHLPQEKVHRNYGQRC